jgi:predicted nucleic acid-binding protein
MACPPKDEWLKERRVDIEWEAAGVPKLIHNDNGKEFHTLALRLDALEIAGPTSASIAACMRFRRSYGPVRRRPPPVVTDPARFVVDFLPADSGRVGRNGFQINRIRYWGPILSRLFPPSARIFVRHDPRDLSRVFVPSPTNAEYLAIPYADLRRPPITLAELERARTQLIAKDHAQPSEDLIFAATEAQRRIERESARRSRRARRNLADSRCGLRYPPRPFQSQP